jgi:hypothetical protein
MSLILMGSYFGKISLYFSFSSVFLCFVRFICCWRERVEEEDRKIAAMRLIHWLQKVEEDQVEGDFFFFFYYFFFMLYF